MKTEQTRKPDDTILPVLNFDRQYINNAKIARIISTKPYNLMDMAKFEISVGNNAINLVDLWLDKNIELSNYNVTQFDMAVMDAAFTIMNAGVPLITAEWISKVMSGNMQQDLSPRKLEEIRNSMDKLACIRIRIDCREEINSRADTRGKVLKFVYESYLLPLSKVEARYAANGKEIVAYSILEKPALYRYAELVHQIVDIPAELLETQEYFSDTDESVLIKRYVIKRVAQIANQNHLHSDRISFLWYDRKAPEYDRERGLFPELGYRDDGSEHFRKKIKPRINKAVKGTLQSLMDKGVISGFSEYREGGTNDPSMPVLGYQIMLPETPALRQPGQDTALSVAGPEPERKYY